MATGKEGIERLYRLSCMNYDTSNQIVDEVKLLFTEMFWKIIISILKYENQTTQLKFASTHQCGLRSTSEVQTKRGGPRTVQHGTSVCVKETMGIHDLSPLCKFEILYNNLYIVLQVC